ncbi:unnamed protein product [Lactuca saligna]|uniref:Uncharacterized protein n=1 Tax=Lactuca saligna TaxID=75948 RepID=A0AA35ZQW4_LACSI|nr:unnamed protein product [Lactuca saligna]
MSWRTTRRRLNLGEKHLWMQPTFSGWETEHIANGQILDDIVPLFRVQQMIILVLNIPITVSIFFGGSNKDAYTNPTHPFTYAILTLPKIQFPATLIVNRGVIHYLLKQNTTPNTGDFRPCCNTPGDDSRPIPTSSTISGLPSSRRCRTPPPALSQTTTVAAPHSHRRDLQVNELQQQVSNMQQAMDEKQSEMNYGITTYYLRVVGKTLENDQTDEPAEPDEDTRF